MNRENETEKNKEVNKINEINDYFKIPIYYNTDKIELKKNIINDLELVNTIDDSCNPIYNYCFNTDSQDSITNKIIEQTSKYYTTDKTFLKDYQILFKDYAPPLLKIMCHMYHSNIPIKQTTGKNTKK